MVFITQKNFSLGSYRPKIYPIGIIAIESFMNSFLKYLVVILVKESCLDSPSSSKSYLKKESTMLTRKINSLMSKTYRETSYKPGKSFTVKNGYAITDYILFYFSG